jgi:thiamine biosynthesis lipoprotein
MFRETRVLMDTYCSITVVSSDRARAKEAIDAGFAVIKRLEEEINYFSADSELSAINKSAGSKPVNVSRDTIDLLMKAVEVSRFSGGAFDPTIAPVLRYWKFSRGREKHSIPPIPAVRKALRLVDYRKIMIDGERSEAFLPVRGMEIDLGGIAKGYAADRAIEAIRSHGISSAIVAVAGDIRTLGSRNDGSAWNIGIQNPRPEKESDRPWEDIIARISIRDAAVSTSGDYQRFFIDRGVRYHHIIDPDTGFPAHSGLISVTVVAPEGYLTDSLATAVFILGPVRGMNLLRSLGLDGVLIKEDRSILITDGLRDRLEILDKRYKLK